MDEGREAPTRCEARYGRTEIEEDRRAGSRGKRIEVPGLSFVSSKRDTRESLSLIISDKSGGDYE